MTQFDLHQQNCIEGMSRLGDESVDLVVTSPPYNLGISYGKYFDRQDRQSYLRWCREWTAQILRVLKPSGSFFLNIGSAPSNPMLPHEITIELTSAPGGFVLQNTIHWIKAATIDDRCSRRPMGDATRSEQTHRSSAFHRKAATAIRSFGHFKPITSKRFLNDCHEYIFHFTKSGRVEIDRLALGVPYQDKSNIARWTHTRGRDKRCRVRSLLCSALNCFIRDKPSIAATAKIASARVRPARDVGFVLIRNAEGQPINFDATRLREMKNIFVAIV